MEEEESGIVEARGTATSAVPIALITIAITIILSYAATLSFLCKFKDKEVAVIGALVNIVRILSSMLFALTIPFLFWDYSTQSLPENVTRALVTMLVATWGFLVGDLVVFRWLHLLGSSVLIIVDGLYLAWQSERLDCQIEGRCVEKDPNWLLITSVARQYGAVTLQLSGIIFGLYLFVSLGWTESAQLPDDTGVSDNMRRLAKAAMQRKQLAETDASARGKVRKLFDPSDALEIKWDEEIDLIIGKNRKSHPISRNAPLGE